MAIFSSSLILSSFKIVIISTAVLFMAVMSKPDFTQYSQFPWINWSLLASWLRPPYLYLLINFIIIAIVVSAKLQPKFDDHPSFSPPPLLQTVLPVQTDHIKVPVGVSSDSFPLAYDGGDVFIKSRLVQVNNKAPADDQISSPTEKPQVSSRFGHRKIVKATPEGGKTLRVSKPKRNDTLESTWKTITDGRPMPVTRHLRKSDTSWETHGGHHHPGSANLQDHNMKMIKSETFNDQLSGSSRNNSSLARTSWGSGKLKKDRSLSQEELNKRVQAFISKFNQDMRLQRQESLNRSVHGDDQPWGTLETFRYI